MAQSRGLFDSSIPTFINNDGNYYANLTYRFFMPKFFSVIGFIVIVIVRIS